MTGFTVAPNAIGSMILHSLRPYMSAQDINVELFSRDLKQAFQQTNVLFASGHTDASTQITFAQHATRIIATLTFAKKAKLFYAQNAASGSLSKANKKRIHLII